jgi:transposase InsO family protein
LSISWLPVRLLSIKEGLGCKAIADIEDRYIESEIKSKNARLRKLKKHLFENKNLTWEDYQKRFTRTKADISNFETLKNQLKEWQTTYNYQRLYGSLSKKNPAQYSGVLGDEISALST